MITFTDVTEYHESFEDVLNQGKELNLKLGNTASDLAQVAGSMKDSIVDTSSIIVKAKNSVLQFPVYITTSGIRANEAHLISKLLERVYASYVQNVLALHKFQSQEDLNNLAFLKYFHTNTRFEESTIYENSYYKPIDELDTIIGESVVNRIDVGNGITMEFRGVPVTDANLIAENARLNNVPLTGLRYLHEASDTVDVKQTEVITDTGVPEKILTDEAIQTIVTYMNQGLPPANQLTVDSLKQLAKSSPTGAKYQDSSGNVKFIYYRKGKDANNPDEYYMAARKNQEKTRTTTQPREKERTIAAPEVLRDVDIKKTNGMLPYGIKVTFRLKNSQSAADIEYIIGVKTILHPIQIKDLIDDIEGIITGNIKSLRKVKYKTGEISFKDYWFDLSGLKADASKRLNKGKRWLASLKQLGEYSKLHGSMYNVASDLIKGGIPIPNASLVISKSEVDAIKDRTGIDIMDVKTAHRLSKAIFLICIMVVDGSAGTMKVLLNGDSDWDTQAIAQLDSELSKLDNSPALKELGKLIYTPRR